MDLLEYQGILLNAEEVNALKTIEETVGLPVKPINILMRYSPDDFAFIGRDHHVIGISIRDTAGKLSSLPDSFQTFSYIRYIGLLRTGIVELPVWFSNLISLEILYIYLNKLTHLPENFGALKNLRAINMCEPDLLCFPESIGELHSLLNFDFYDCDCGPGTLPESFGNLQSLEILDFYGSNLTTLPASFGKLKALRELNLMYCNFRNLPSSLLQLPKLAKLCVGGNNLNVGSASHSQKVILQLCRKGVDVHDTVNTCSIHESKFFDDNLTQIQ